MSGAGRGGACATRRGRAGQCASVNGVPVDLVAEQDEIVCAANGHEAVHARRVDAKAGWVVRRVDHDGARVVLEGCVRTREVAEAVGDLTAQQSNVFLPRTIL